MPERIDKDNLIETRYREINDYEKYLYGTGTRVVKIFLNVSKDEQAKRFISRIDVPRKNWKISEGDIKEREYWDEYQEAFETMVNKTATKNCPWYVVPADRKWYARLIVSRIVLETLREVDPQFPVVSDEDMERIEEYRESLVNSLSEYQKMKFLKESEDAEANEGGSEESAENISENTEEGAITPADEEGKVNGCEETPGGETVTTNNEEQVEGSDIVNSTETENESSIDEVVDANSDDEKSEDDSEKDDDSKEDEADKKEEDEEDEDEDEKEEKSSKKSKHEKKSKKWKKKRKKALKKLKSFKTEEEKKAYIKKMIAKGKYGYFVEEDDIEEGKCPFEEAENVSLEIVTE
jgi:hypothetical protein